MGNDKEALEKGLGLVLQVNYLLYGWITEIERRTLDEDAEKRLRISISRAIKELDQLFPEPEMEDAGEAFETVNEKEESEPE